MSEDEEFEEIEEFDVRKIVSLVLILALTAIVIMSALSYMNVENIPEIKFPIVDTIINPEKGLEFPILEQPKQEQENLQDKIKNEIKKEYEKYIEFGLKKEDVIILQNYQCDVIISGNYSENFTEKFDNEIYHGIISQRVEECNDL